MVLNPRAKVTTFVVVLVFALTAVATLTVFSLVENHSDIAEATASVRISDAYWDAFNSATDASLYASQLDETNNEETHQDLVSALSAAFAAADEIRESGSQQDRQIIADLEERYAAPIAQALLFLENPRDNSLPTGAGDAESLLIEVKEALRVPAEQQRELALQSLESLDTSTRNRSIAIIAALGLAIPLTMAVVLAIRHYERRDARREIELKELSEAALADSITGLGNHRAFQEELQGELLRTMHRHSLLTLVLADIDDFKRTNDNQGHAHGDFVLAAFAKSLSLILPEAKAFRVGGDEFALIVPDRPAESLLPEIDTVLKLTKGGLEGLTASFGLCTSSASTDSADLRQKADLALYAAKTRGKSQSVIYDAILDQERRELAAEAAELDRILSTKDVKVVFQPIFEVKNHRIVACEALARLDSFLAGPAEAFLIAHHSGHSWALDRLCLDAALESAEALPEDLRLFLNLDPQSLNDPRFSAAQISQMVRSHGLTPNQIVVELTEQAMVPEETLRFHLAQLRSEGFGLALDDVGAGNAGLQLLRMHQFDYLKVDRSVIEAATRGDSNAKGVLFAILAFAAETHVHVIAEGIEVKESAQMLETIAERPLLVVEAVQGFLLSPPLPSMTALRAELRRHAA